jgi:cysteine desulfurase / selenocysteine lyase
MTFDPESVRRDFPIFAQRVRGGKPLVYLDTAVTSQKPRQVIEAVTHFFEHDNGSVHRGVYELSERATATYEGARKKAAKLLGGRDHREVVFVRGTTEAINLVATSWGRKNISAGDEILITAMEHHSNIVPWQLLCEEKGAKLVVAPITDAGDIDEDAFRALLNEKTKLVACVHVSNSLGTVNDVKAIAKAAHAVGAKVLVDGAQSVPHMAVDVTDLDVDFYTFSAHKVYGPSAIGCLWARYSILEEMPPYQGGGNMISNVTFEKTSFAKPPGRFEAGTPNMEGSAGLSAAIDYVNALGFSSIEENEKALLAYAHSQLEAVPGLTLIGRAKHQAGVVSFTLKGAHPHDVGSILDREGVCVRAGHHCTQPVMVRYAVPATTRASFGVYSTRGDIDALVRAVDKVRLMFA